MLKGLAVKCALALGAGALFAFSIGWLVSRFDGMIKGADARGYDRGVAEMALKYEQTARETRDALEAAARAREAAIEARRAAAEQRASEAEKRTSAALRELMINDTEFSACMASPYPDSVRRHLPPGML